MKVFFTILLSLPFIAGMAQTGAPSLSASATVSLLTCSPTDDGVYTVYGHTSIRVSDRELGLDRVFNYGIFDFSKPNFIYRFAKGETDYRLASGDFGNFLAAYAWRGSEVCEQVLNLLPKEKEALWQALVHNELPENRVYRYNFFFDNCATRPEAMISKNIRGMIRYVKTLDNKTFRDAINYCTRNHPWQTFGCDLVLGKPTDRVMTMHEAFFLPEYLRKALDRAIIIDENGMRRMLVSQTNILADASIERTPAPSPLTTPLAASIAFFIIIALLTFTEWRLKMYFRALDCVLFFIAGMAGCLLYFLCFASVHPSIFPNISILWLHPFHLVGVVLISVKKFNKMAFWYHFINFAAIFGMSAVWIFYMQHFNVAFAPLIGALALRSGAGIYNMRRMNKIRNLVK